MNQHVKNALNAMQAADQMAAIHQGPKSNLELRAQTYVLMDIADSLRKLANPMLSVDAVLRDAVK